MAKRISNSDNFIDVYKKNDQEISKLSKELEIDIAIDLMGFVNNNRYKIFAKGCAPIHKLFRLPEPVDQILWIIL